MTVAVAVIAGRRGRAVLVVVVGTTLTRFAAALALARFSTVAVAFARFAAPAGAAA